MSGENDRPFRFTTGNYPNIENLLKDRKYCEMIAMKQNGDNLTGNFSSRLKYVVVNIEECKAMLHLTIYKNKINVKVLNALQ
ncbi:hypothetical protein POWCR01_080014700 [Plasmodium ovale]|uniref:Uncharacterized protein n=1 Tax=Plasmodium ovale TaxID=36330 RepID=A0A1C3KRA3_PLAOA|nr:hypothetical protein POWCR01_080014700 [Plasmodium ovale]